MVDRARRTADDPMRPGPEETELEIRSIEAGPDPAGVLLTFVATGARVCVILEPKEADSLARRLILEADRARRAAEGEGADDE